LEEKEFGITGCEDVDRIRAHPCRSSTLDDASAVIVLPKVERYGNGASQRLLDSLPEAVRSHPNLYLWAKGPIESGYHTYKNIPEHASWISLEPWFNGGGRGFQHDYFTGRPGTPDYVEPEIPDTHEACYPLAPDPYHRNIIAIPYPGNYEKIEEIDIRSIRRGTAYFYGAGLHGKAKLLRARLKRLCIGDKDCTFWEGHSHEDYVAKMLDSTFCFCPTGDTPSRETIFFSIRHGCIPVLFSSCPESVILQGYPTFLPTVPTQAEFGVRDWAILLDQKAVMTNATYVARELQAISIQQIDRMRNRLNDIRPSISFSSRLQVDAADLLVQKILLKRK